MVCISETGAGFGRRGAIPSGPRRRDEAMELTMHRHLHRFAAEGGHPDAEVRVETLVCDESARPDRGGGPCEWSVRPIGDGRVVAVRLPRSEPADAPGLGLSASLAN